MNSNEVPELLTRQPVVEVMEPMMVEVMRNKSPSERLAIGFRMWDSALAIVTASVRRQNPHWSEGKLQEEISIRMRGRFDW